MLLDLGEGRLRDMAQDGVQMQVLSLVAPGVQIFDAETAVPMAKDINNQLSQIVRDHPDHYIGLATIAPQEPEAAADELERSVVDLGLKGALINSHTKDEYLDKQKFWVILERANRLKVPIYIHPRMPSPSLARPFMDYPMLGATLGGFSAETSLHAMRLILSGVFDEYPDLKIILGHLGEGLPYWMWRMDNMWKVGPLVNKFKKTPGQYIKDNFLITTSGMFWEPPFLCSYLALGADSIMLAVDYPLEDSKIAVRFLNSLPICDGDKEKIGHSNAERVFSI
jgi:2,3-dihydroxybenzoate decarboxylase